LYSASIRQDSERVNRRVVKALFHQLPASGKVVAVDLRKVALYESKKSWLHVCKVA